MGGERGIGADAQGVLPTNAPIPGDWTMQFDALTRAFADGRTVAGTQLDELLDPAPVEAPVATDEIYDEPFEP